MVDSGEISEIDWDNLLENIPDDLNFDFFDDLNIPPLNNEFSLSTSPDSACLQSIDDVEQYLFNDDDFSDDGQKKVEENVVVQVKENDTVAKENDAVAVVVDDDDDDDDNAAEENDDPAAKKRKRQMRNRDAAIRSRERKKSYVKDLEMKSKYYEAECKRLGILFQCCLAENQALRLSLHNTKAFDASMSKQESAVLFLESLLLGSLLGFLGIICLQILLLSTLEVGRLKSVLSAKKGRAPPRKAGSEVFKVPVLQSFMMGKGCRASRSRMKTDLFWVS